MDHKVALSFEDGVTRFITCAEDQTVADASYRARINIPVDCNDGACGTCKALCESGTYDPGRYVDDALTAAEAAKGLCLPCQIKPTSDLVLQIRSTSDVAKTTAATYTGRLVNLRRLSPTVMAFGIELADRDALTYLPGQYVNIAVPGTGETRSYSFSTSPADGPLEFLVKLVPGGVMSSWLERAAEGDEVSFTGPHGSFFLREATRPALLLAGGTGLAPILAMLRSLRPSGTARRLHLVYGATTDDDVVELDALAELSAALPNFTWDYCVADKATLAPHQGYVTGLITDAHLHSGDVAVYLCGPPPMVEAVRTFLDDRGIEPNGFYYEKFTPATPAAAAVPAPVAAPTPAPTRCRSRPPHRRPRHGIRVVSAAAGGTEAPARRVQRGPLPQTDQEKAWYQTIVDQTVESSLLKRYGTLDEQAAPITFLASAEASYITGVVLPVGGGDLG